jgi:hypothetical protein
MLDTQHCKTASRLIERVFCFQNCSDLLVRKNCSSDQEKVLKFKAEGRKFAKILTIYSNIERSVQFLKQNAFLTCSSWFLRCNTFEQLAFKLEK